MRFSVLQENFEKGLSIINHVASQKAQLPILGHVLIRSTKEGLSLSATDLESGIEIHIPAKIEEEGELAIPARIILELVSSLSQEKIDVLTEKDALTIQTPTSTSQILGMSAQEFPKIFEGEKELLGKVSREKIKQIIERVTFAASVDEGRPVLTGALFHFSEASSVVATDGYRLSLQKTEIKKTGKDEAGIDLLVPVKIFKQLLLFLSEKEESDIEFYQSKNKNQIVIGIGESVLVGRLLEGEFPNYERIIPTSKNTQVLLDKQALLKSVKTCAIFARESANIIRMKVGKNTASLSANSPSVGENTVTIDARVTGEENEIAFNSRFLLDFLVNIEGEEIIFEMTGPLNPGLFRIAGDDSFLHIIMPVRIQTETGE